MGVAQGADAWHISIHALLAESDLDKAFQSSRLRIFLSTLSLRRATSLFCSLPHPYRYFYPRSPCGERPSTFSKTSSDTAFLSTLSLRRATNCNRAETAKTSISIHALLAESDCGCFARCRYWAYFYPRSPCGERLITLPPFYAFSNFYPRSPCGERPLGYVRGCFFCVFLSTLSLRRATLGAWKSCYVY